MALHLSIFLILTGLTGVYSIITVTKVSVKAGHSISIPCLYDQKYINYVKYLCEGYRFRSCSFAVKTNRQISERFLISDDKRLKIFTVTIQNVTEGDTHFWCAVEVNGGIDVSSYFQLSAKGGVSSLYVDTQEETGFIGGPATIKCYSQNSGEAKWCRLGGSCVQESQGSIDGTTVILDRNLSSVLRVTMRGLKMEDSGWYWCATGDLQMPVHLSVREESTTSRKPEDAETDASETADEDAANSLSGSFMALIISLSLLIFIMILSLFIWFCIKRQKQIQEKSSAEVLAEDKVMNSKVMKNRESSGQPLSSGNEITYSCLEMPQQERRPGPLCSKNVVYYSSVKIRQRDQACDTTNIYSNLTYSHNM